MGSISKGSYFHGDKMFAKVEVGHEKVNHSEDMEDISDEHKCAPQVNLTIFSSFLQIQRKRQIKINTLTLYNNSLAQIRCMCEFLSGTLTVYKAP